MEISSGFSLSIKIVCIQLTLFFVGNLEGAEISNVRYFVGLI